MKNLTPIKLQKYFFITIILMIILLLAFSCSPQKLTKYAVVKSVDDMQKYYKVVSYLPNGTVLENYQPYCDFASGDTVKISQLWRNGWMEVRLHSVK